MSPLLIATGDPAGVGPSISVRAAARVASRERAILFGDASRLEVMLAREKVKVIDAALDRAHGISLVDTGRVDDAAIEAHAPSAEGGRAQLAALDAAIDAIQAGRGRAIVTAPISKAAVESCGVPFVGHTEHLARRAGLADDAVTMLFLGPKLKVALATTHLSLRAVPDAIEAARVERAIVHLAEALARIENRRPLRVAVAGVNPHAGERGLFGNEEIERVAPAIERARAYVEVEIAGPIGAETAFRLAASSEIDGVVAMFHDQATIASKLLDWGAAVNVTWGLPFVRTSVDHGVAYDAAARDVADAAGMEAAVDMAILLTETQR
jgi:4-hydroxythreonine-4-phosphate dehydrogenase